MAAQTVLTCPSCQTKLALAGDLKVPAKVKCPKCSRIIEVPAAATAPVPASAPAPAPGPERWLPLSLLPVIALYVSLLSLVLLVLLRQFVLGLVLAALAAVGACAGWILAIRKGETGTINHVVALPACFAAVLLGINAFTLKGRLERNEELHVKAEQAAAQSKADLGEAKKKWLEVEEAPRKAAEMLKKAEEAPRRAEELFAKAKEAQKAAQDAEKNAAALVLKNEALEKDLKPRQKQVADDRKRAEDAQSNVERMHKQIEAKTTQMVELQSKIEDDRRKAEERNKETQELMRKVEEAVRGVVGDLKNKKPEARLKATTTLAKFAAYRPPLPGDTVRTLCEMVVGDPVAEVKEQSLTVLEKLTPELYPHIKTLTRPPEKAAAPPYASYAAASTSLGELGKKARPAAPIILNQLDVALKTLAKEAADAAGPDKALVSSIKSHVGALGELSADDPTTIGAIAKIPAFSSDPDYGWLRLLSYKALTSSLEANRQLTKLILPLLVKGLSDKDDGVRLLIIPVLEKMGPSAVSAVPELRELRFNPNEKIREAVTRALKVLDKGG